MSSNYEKGREDAAEVKDKAEGAWDKTVHYMKDAGHKIGDTVGSAWSKTKGFFSGITSRKPKAEEHTRHSINEDDGLDFPEKSERIQDGFEGAQTFHTVVKDESGNVIREIHGVKKTN